MKKLLFVSVWILFFALSIGFESCTDEIAYDAHPMVINQTTTAFDNLSNAGFDHFLVPECDRLYSNAILIDFDSVSISGQTHNEVLDSLLKVNISLPDFISQLQVNSRIFSSHLDDYQIHQSNFTLADNIFNYEIEPLIDTAFLTGMISINAKEFLHSIAKASLRDSVNFGILFEQLNNMKHQKREYLLCSTVFAITEYSNCYWTANQNDDRILQACLVLDCLAGIGQSFKNLYDSSRNNWQYDTNEWLGSCGRAAAWGSTLGRFGL